MGENNSRNNLLSALNKDLPAGLVVFLVALPLCLGIALASGAPLFSGIISGIVGGIVVSLISNSSLGVSGPAAGLAVIVFSAIQTLGSFEVFLCAVFIAGVIQLILGAIKAGIVAYYFTSSVIKGMLAAIGLILILKQIPHVLGFNFTYEVDNYIDVPGKTMLGDIVHAVQNPSLGALIISLVAFAAIFSWDYVIKKSRSKALGYIPGALIAVIAGILINILFKAYAPSLYLNGSLLVSIPSLNSVDDFNKTILFPDLSGFTDPRVYTIGLVLAIVASLETLLSVEAVDKIDPHKRTTNTNRELVAQGLGNITSSLIGGMPITQVIVRSSANVQSGGQTRMASFFHGTLLLASVLAVPFVMNLIPLSALAVVLLFVGYKLCKPALFREMYKTGWNQFLPFAVTVIAIVSTDLLKGIGIGLGVSIFFLLKNNYRLSYYLRRIKGEERKKIILQLAEEVSFLNKANILQILNRMTPKMEVIVDASNTRYIDYDVLEIFETFKHSAHEKDVSVSFIGLEKFTKN